MSAIYDNWERLVAAVLKREQFLELCRQHLRTPSICSESSDHSSTSYRSSDDHVKLETKDESVAKPFAKLVFLGGSGPGYRLKDTLSLEKEVGKGRFGTSILSELLKDVHVSDQEFLPKGTRMVMKLLQQVNVTADEYIEQMMIFRDCRHENVAAPKAYYFSNHANGKLILYDYYSRGSVFDMLQDKTSVVTWESHVKIAIGAARGIAHIHSQCGGNLAHGNIKSSNIFLNSNHYGCVSDFSLAGIIKEPPMLKGVRYHASKHITSVSQERDVYDFGNLLLELLTRKSPLEAQGFDKDMELFTWVRSIKYNEWTSKLFDQTLKRQILDKNDLVEMVKTEIPGVEFSVDDVESFRAILRSRFHSMAKVPMLYFPAQDLVQMVETH